MNELHATARIGQLGETCAIDLLRREGLHIVARNWRSGSYELDVVAERQGVLYFVEVKTRQTDGLTTPEEALTAHKRRSLLRAAQAFLATAGARYEGYEIQFDLVAVTVDADGKMHPRRIEQAIEYGW